jgi:hypothetical protein
LRTSTRPSTGGAAERTGRLTELKRVYDGLFHANGTPKAAPAGAAEKLRVLETLLGIGFEAFAELKTPSQLSMKYDANNIIDKKNDPTFRFHYYIAFRSDTYSPEDLESRRGPQRKVSPLTGQAYRKRLGSSARTTGRRCGTPSATGRTAAGASTALARKTTTCSP